MTSRRDRGGRGAWLSRRKFVAGVSTAVAVVGSTMPAAALESKAVDGTLSKLVLHEAGFRSFSPHAAAVTHGDSNDPSMHVYYVDGKRDSLKKWVEADDSRDLLSEHEGDRVMTIRAPVEDFGVRWLDRYYGEGLASRDYVQFLDQNIEVSLPDPVTPRTRTNVNLGSIADAPGVSSLEAYLSMASTPSKGVAFDEDMNQETVKVVREVLGADGGSISLPDTSSIRVAVVDTGANHNDDVFGDGLGGSRIVGKSRDFVAGGVVENDGLGAVSDHNGHGTWIASLYSADPSDATYRGLLPQSEVLALRALDSEGSGKTADIGAAIRYAADHDADIIVLSLGSPLHSYELDRAIAYAEGAGAITFAAVGNDRQGSRYPASPSSSPRAFGVASTTAQPPSDALSAYYSNVGPHPGSTDFSGGETADAQPTFAAPGCRVEVLTVRPDGTTEPEALTGTSMANPASAAVAGLLMASDDSFRGDFDALHERLTQTAEPVPNAGRYEVGHGMVNAQNAIENVEPSTEQPEARIQEAKVRDRSYESMSNASGRKLFLF